MASYLNTLRSLPEVRQDLIDRVREEIASGAYDTPEKVEQALDAIQEDLQA
jgi:hypothetical protein